MNRRHIPNVITVLRLLLVPPVIVFVFNQQYAWALTLFVIAGVSDGVDGFLARYYGWRSQLGAILDPLADKTLIIATYLMLGWQTLIPAWLVAVVVLRDVVMLVLASLYRVLSGKLDISPSLISKINTVMQIALAVVIMLFQATGFLWSALVDALALLVLLTTAWSGIGYGIEFAKKTRAKQ